MPFAGCRFSPLRLRLSILDGKSETVNQQMLNPIFLVRGLFGGWNGEHPDRRKAGKG